MGATNGRLGLHDPERKTNSSLSHDSDFSLSATSVDYTDNSYRSSKSVSFQDSDSGKSEREDSGSGGGGRGTPLRHRLRDVATTPGQPGCSSSTTSGSCQSSPIANSANCPRHLFLRASSANANANLRLPPLHDVPCHCGNELNSPANNINSTPQQMAPPTGGHRPPNRMSPRVYGNGPYAGSANSATTTVHSCDGGDGRTSPGHDLGYHTLLGGRDPSVTPTRQLDAAHQYHLHQHQLQQQQQQQHQLHNNAQQLRRPPIGGGGSVVARHQSPSPAWTTELRSTSFNNLVGAVTITSGVGGGSTSSSSSTQCQPPPPLPALRGSPRQPPQIPSMLADEGGRLLLAPPPVSRMSHATGIVAGTTTNTSLYKMGKRSPRSSPFDRLTDDLVLHVLSYLSTNQLCACARVCRRWYFLTYEPQLWTRVELHGERVNADRALHAIFQLLCRDSPSVCLTVERVVLNGCTRLTDHGLMAVARRCPELRRLELKGCHGVTNAGLFELAAGCVNLEHLDVTGCTQINCLEVSSQQSMASDALLPSSRQLAIQFLDMTDCHGLEDPGLKVIVRNCPQLSHLYLRRCVGLTDVGVKYVAIYCQVLRELSISDCVQVTDFGMYELAKLGPNLRYMSVAKCDQISDAGIKQIARHCYKLRYLNARGCEAVSDDSIVMLARSCPRLRAIDIGKCDITDFGLKLLSENCPNLKKLSVKSCDMVTDKGIQCISYYCRGLQQLNIQDCQITIDGYRTVKKFCKRCIIEHTNPGFC